MLFVAFFSNSQTGVSDFNNWSIKGNSISTNTAFIGTTSNRSMKFKTNNTIRGKIDSLGTFNWYSTLAVNMGTTSAASPRTFSFQPYVSATTLPALYMGIGIPTASNYAWAASDSTIFIYNAPSIMRFNTNGTNWLIASTTQTTAHSMVTLSGVSIPTVAANSEIRAFTIGARTVGWNTGSTALQRDILFSSHTYTANGAGHSITNAVQAEFNAPTIGTGVTVSGTTFATYHKGNVNVTSKLSIGSALLNPNALLHLAAPPTGTPAIKFTSHTVPTLNAGEIDYNSTTGFNLQGNMLLSGTQTISTNQIVVGTSSVGSTFTAGAGVRAVGAFSCASTGSIGSTFTVSGASALTGITNTGTLSCSSTSTLTGNTTFGGSALSTSASGGIGYTTGSGGTVTQLTDKNTAVTLNKICGKITMASGNLTTGAQALFTLTNSSIGANDVVLVCHSSGGTNGSYEVAATNISAGSCSIWVENRTTGTLNEAIVLTFIVIKASTN